MSQIRKAFIAFAMLCMAAGPALAMPMPSSTGLHASTPAPAPSSGLGGLLGLVGGGAAVFGITIKKDIGSIATKFVQRAQAATGDYKTGVSNAGGSWEQGAAGAETAWEQGTQAAMTNKRFTKGVQGKGGKYQTNAVNLGSQRYGPGVANSQAAYQAGMAPVLQTLQGIQLPAKSFRGSPANMDRANKVATALAAMRANK